MIFIAVIAAIVALVIATILVRLRPFLIVTVS
jgi:hypothetical protein